MFNSVIIACFSSPRKICDIRFKKMYKRNYLLLQPIPLDRHAAMHFVVKLKRTLNALYPFDMCIMSEL